MLLMIMCSKCRLSFYYFSKGNTALAVKQKCYLILKFILFFVFGFLKRREKKQRKPLGLLVNNPFLNESEICN